MNLQPIVGDVLLNSFFTNRSARLDFPTPELPRRTIFTLRVCTGLFSVSLWSWALPGTLGSFSPIKSTLYSKRVGKRRWTQVDPVSLFLWRSSSCGSCLSSLLQESLDVLSLPHFPENKSKTKSSPNLLDADYVTSLPGIKPQLSHKKKPRSQ